MFVLDTNVISELKHGKINPSPQVRAWAASYSEYDFFISAMTILELEKGVLALEYRTPSQGSALRRWLEGVKFTFAGRILPFSEHTATICARLHIPNPKPEADAMIAACAIEHNLIIATCNTDDFSDMGVSLINPWHYSAHV